jgi:hypothetical protein
VVGGLPTGKVRLLLVVKFYAKSSMKIQKLIENLIIENFQKSVFFLFESADSVLPILALRPKVVES